MELLVTPLLPYPLEFSTFLFVYFYTNISIHILVENLFKKNSLQDLLSSLNPVISTNESTQIITGHAIYNPAYTYKFQLKTTKMLKWGREGSKIGDVIYGEPPIATCNLVLMATKMESR